MRISLVVPVFNEEDAIPLFYKAVREHEELIKYEVEIVFINDGSKDATESIINALAIADGLVKPLCSGQLKLATVLEFFRYWFSDSFGGNPPLYSCGLTSL